MALTTVNITGTFNFPDATWSQYTKAEFHLSGYDTDTEVVVPKVVSVTLGAGGELDVDLWGNDDGLRGTVYRVNVVSYEGSAYNREILRRDLGRVQISGDGPLDIATLLDAPVTVPEVWYSTITEAEYNAAIQAASDAATSAEQAEAFGNPSFNTIALMAAYEGAIDGQTVSVYDAFNGSREDFDWVAGGTLTADGALVVDGVGGQWVSNRTVYADWAEFDSDPRSHDVGTSLSVEGLNGAYTVVTTGEDLTLSSGLKAVLLTFGRVTTHHFGGVGDRVADDTEALKAAISYCKAKGVPLRDRVDRWFRITDPDGIWLGSANTTNPCRGVSTNIVIAVEGGRGFDLTGIQNGHRDEYDLRVETASGVTAAYGFIQARPYRTASVVYSSGNTGKIKLWFAGDAYGPAYYNVASESNVVQSVFLSNRSGLSSAWCKDDYFAGKALMTIAAATNFFTVGDTLTGVTSGATAKLLRNDGGNRLFVEILSGTFDPTEDITDGSATRQLAEAPYVFGTASAFTAIQDGFPPSTSTFQAIRDMWANNGSADKLWPTVLVRSFASIVFDTPNVNTTDGGDLFEFHGDCSPIVNFGYLHGVHRYSLVFGDVHDATSQVMVRGKFVGLNAGNVTARVKTNTDLVRFEDCVFDLEGDLDFGGTALNGHTEIRLGAYAMTASGRLEGYLFYDSQGGSDLSGITSGPTDNRMRKADTSSTVQNGFTAMTGTSRKGALDTSTVTLVQLAERVKAIEAAALAAGVILPA